MFLFKKNVDKSMLYVGMAIPKEVQKNITASLGIMLEKGATAQIKITIENDDFDAIITRYNTGVDMMQIHYGAKSLLANRLRAIFHFTDNQLKGTFVLPNNCCEYAEIYVIDGKLYLECVSYDEISGELNKSKLVQELAIGSVYDTEAPIARYEYDKTSGYESILKEYYARYLVDVRGLSQSSVAHYYDALNNISRKLHDMKLINNNIYEIDNLEQLAEIREILYADAEFIEQNERGKRMYSAGLNNYYRFASGVEFRNLKDKILLLDIPVAPKDVISVENKVQARSSIIREQAMEFAGYACEINNSHESFVAEKNHKPYMESHHAVPMRLQSRFNNSLDVYANIVCLCPVCHRRIHYGMKEDKCHMLDQIYVSRSERLAHSGISMSQQEFIDLVVNT